MPAPRCLTAATVRRLDGQGLAAGDDTLRQLVDLGVGEMGVRAILDQQPRRADARTISIRRW